MSREYEAKQYGPFGTFREALLPQEVELLFLSTEQKAVYDDSDNFCFFCHWSLLPLPRLLPPKIPGAARLRRFLYL